LRLRQQCVELLDEIGGWHVQGRDVKAEV
jgi:hypothetical protein